MKQIVLLLFPFLAFQLSAAPTLPKIFGDHMVLQQGRPVMVWGWAEAKIDGDKVILSSPDVEMPVAVRYAYSSNPKGANLYNREGIPASPFRTDDW